MRVDVFSRSRTNQPHHQKDQEQHMVYSLDHGESNQARYSGVYLGIGGRPLAPGSVKVTLALGAEASSFPV